MFREFMTLIRDAVTALQSIDRALHLIQANGLPVPDFSPTCNPCNANVKCKKCGGAWPSGDKA